jgi:hypothetical protein
MMGAAAPLNAAIHGASRMTMSWVASSRRITAVNLPLANGFRFAPGKAAISPNLALGSLPHFQSTMIDSR